MRFDLSAARAFLNYLDGNVDLEEVLMQPAYRAVFSHASLFGTGLHAHDVTEAILGRSTPFYGLKNLAVNRLRIEKLLAQIELEAARWQQLVVSETTHLVPGADLGRLTIYPIIGYDAGIGHSNSICMNVNWQPFQDAPLEFLYLAIHESFHAVYEHIHQLPRLQQIRTCQDRFAYFCSMLQNEGMAVYAPLRLRRANRDEGYLHHPIIGEDYLALGDEREMRRAVRKFRELLIRLREEDMELEHYAELVFGPERITYRVGCRLAELIEYHLGLQELQKAVHLTGEEMVAQYSELLSAKCPEAAGNLE